MGERYVDMGKKCVTDTVRVLYPHLRSIDLNIMTLEELLSLLPRIEHPEVILQDRSDPSCGVDGLLVPHRRRAPSSHHY